jgi:hypothetical protein
VLDVAKKKQKSSSVERELKAVVKKLKARLAAAEESARTWRARAKARRSDVAAKQAELTGVQRRLDKAEASAAKWKARAKAPAPAAPPVPQVPEPTVETTDAAMTASVSPTTSGPDDSWTVTALRAEARSRGVAGYSRKSKAQLLAELQG